MMKINDIIMEAEFPGELDKHTPKKDQTWVNNNDNDVKIYIRAVEDGTVIYSYYNSYDDDVAGTTKQQTTDYIREYFHLT